MVPAAFVSENFDDRDRISLFQGIVVVDLESTVDLQRLPDAAVDQPFDDEQEAWPQ